MQPFQLRLPAYSNREDLLIPLQLYDDETDEPLNLSGTTGNGTSSSWTVTAGAVITASVSSLTIPQFPIGDELLALSLTVPASLDINADDPIRLVDDTNGNNTMVGYVTSYNAQTGALVAQIGLAFQFEIRAGGERESGSGYVPWYDFGVPSDVGPLIKGSLGDGIYITDVGNIQIQIPEVTMKKLHAHTFKAYLTFTNGQETRQAFVASLPIVYGGVTT